MGLNVALQLAKRGLGKSVVVFEKGVSLGEGSTGASSAILRHYYTYDEMIQMTCDGYRAYTNWSTYLERPEEELAASFSRTCAVWLTGDTNEGANQQAERLRRFGVPSNVLGIRDVVKRWPAMSSCLRSLDTTGETEHECRPTLEDLAANASLNASSILVEENCGYFEPVAALQDLCDTVRRLGVRVHLNSPIADVRTASGRVLGVTTRDGEHVDCGVVVNCSGPWTNKVMAMAGASVPFTLDPTRIQVIYRKLAISDEACLPATDSRDAVLPFVVDSYSGIYMRPQLKQRQVLCSTVREEDERESVPDDQLDSFVRTVDPDVRDQLRHALEHRVLSPALLDGARGFGQLCGMYTINRNDFHPLIGPVAGLDGFIACNGFSGHGFKIAPAVGSMVAQLVSRQRLSSSSDALAFETGVDPSFFSPNREPLPLERKGVLA